MKRLSPLDACFLYMESSQTPMHIGALLTFKLPPKAGRDYLSQLVARLRGYPASRPPFNHVLVRSPLSLMPAWEITQDVDLDYHLRHSALPRPGGQRELGMLIERLHSHPLDLTRPPWECHVIEGLEKGRFAIYFKAHHSAVDGAGGLKLLRAWLSPKAQTVSQPPPWAMPMPPNLRVPGPGVVGPLARGLLILGSQLRALPELVHHLKRASRQYPNGSIGALFKAPHSLLNGSIDGQRRLATQHLRLARLKAVAERAEASINDVALAVCGGALRRYLLELDALPRRSLVALVPVALGRRRGGDFGDAVSGLLTDLETQIADPIQRLQAITRSTQVGKQHLRSMSPAAAAQRTMLLMTPLTLCQLASLGTRLPPLFNLVVSNVPIAQEKLYFGDAELEGLFPVALLFRGQALNITVLGYADTLSFSFTACRDSLPSVQRLAVYTGDALSELEQALGLADTSEMRVVSIHSAPRVRQRLQEMAGGTESGV